MGDGVLMFEERLCEEGCHRIGRVGGTEESGATAEWGWKDEVGWGWRRRWSDRRECEVERSSR
jgi:hypothetical protein